MGNNSLYRLCLQDFVPLKGIKGYQNRWKKYSTHAEGTEKETNRFELNSELLSLYNILLGVGAVVTVYEIGKQLLEHMLSN